MSDALIALMQLNVALGCLYNGLEVARYRTKLYRAIAESVDSVPEYADVVDNLNSNSSFANNSELSECHHAVRRWVYELPAEYQKRIEQIEKWNFEGPTSPEKLPSIYRLYFGKNYDKVLVWTLSVVTPLSLIWAAYFNVDVFKWGWTITLIGQLAPLVNVWFGRQMITTVSRDVEEKLEKIVSIYQKDSVSPTIEKARQSLPGSASDEGEGPWNE